MSTTVVPKLTRFLNHYRVRVLAHLDLYIDEGDQVHNQRNLRKS